MLQTRQQKIKESDEGLQLLQVNKLFQNLLQQCCLEPIDAYTVTSNFIGKIKSN